MQTIKAGRPLLDFIRLCYKADRPALICGQHGIGKSAMLEQAASELGIRTICRDLSLMELTDLIGMPETNGKTTVHLAPSFLPKQGKGLLVFEGLNRCERYMLAPFLQRLTARQLNDYCLPRGWLPVAVINPLDADDEVSELEPALLSRFAQVQVVPDRTEWLAWAERNKVHAEVIKYVGSNDSIFDDPQSNPRTWEYVSDFLNAAGRKGMAQSSIHAAVFGLVGKEHGIAFLCSPKLACDPLTAHDIIDDYPLQRKRLLSWLRADRTDLVEASVRAVNCHLETVANLEAIFSDHQSTANFSLFFSDLPEDLKRSVIAPFAEQMLESDLI